MQQPPRPEPPPPLSLPPPSIDANTALFLDFDGTLADLAPRPDAVHVPPSLIDALLLLQQSLQGALAIVSGRPIAQLDALLAPLRAPAAGVHGVERRSADGYVWHLAAPSLDRVEATARALQAEVPALLIERKPGAVALHYRQAPELGPHCHDAMSAAVRESTGLTLLHGKMVLEVKPAIATKGHAIQAYLREPPFLGRRPLFAGDDVTDEAGFEAVRAAGGDTIKVGDGETVALHRMADPGSLRHWLAECAARLAPQHHGTV